MKSTWRVWERREMPTKYWRENLKEGDHYAYLDVDGRIIELILKKQDERT